MSAPFYRLMLLTHRQERPLAEYLAFIESCLGFVTAVQLREKTASEAFLLDYAQQLKALLKPYQVPLIINDNLELALEVDAEGLHLGQTDGSPEVARQRLGADKWLGVSIETEADLLQANQAPVDYVAASAVFPSRHKANLKTIWGLEGLSLLSRQSTHPLIAIGGISLQNISEVIAAGAQGAAVIGALHEAENPALTASAFSELIQEALL